MGSGIYSSLDGTDDGWINGTMIQIDPPDSASNNFMGHSAGWGGSLSMYARFQDVTIPRGAVITSAILRFTANAAYSANTVNLTISMHDTDDAEQLAIRDDYIDATKTDSVAWTGVKTVILNEEFDSPDISSIIQNVIDREGWQPGNAMMVFLQDASSTAEAYRGSYAYNHHESYPEFEDYPLLIVEWSSDVPVADMTLIAHAPYRHAEAPAGDMALTALAPTTAIACPVPVATMTFLGRNPAHVWEVAKAVRVTAQKIYICILTGAPDSLEDVEIPMSSFQSRLRDGESSYLAAVIPNSTLYEADVTARPNGEIVIKMGYLMSDGTRALEEIARVDYETMQLDRGARNDSMTIVGHKTVTSTAPKEREVKVNTFYGLNAAGKRRIRSLPDLFLKPGDTLIYGTGGNDYLIVAQITYYVDTRQAIMEVTEA
jgi:hypothetical protein